MKYLIQAIIILLFLSCSADQSKKTAQANKKEKISSPKKKGKAKGKTKKYGPYAKALQKELKITNSELDEVLSVSTKYAKKVKTVRANKKLEKKSAKISQLNKQKQDEMKKVLKQKYNSKIQFDKKWKKLKNANK